LLAKAIKSKIQNYLMTWTVAIAGKGGTGKTTVASLLIRGLARLGKGPVLAVDADPDTNLHTGLGMTVNKTVGQWARY